MLFFFTSLRVDGATRVEYHCGSASITSNRGPRRARSRALEMQNLARPYRFILLKIPFRPLRSRSSGCPPSLFISLSSRLSPPFFPHHMNPLRFINIKRDGESSGLPPTLSILPLSPPQSAALDLSEVMYYRCSRAL